MGPGEERNINQGTFSDGSWSNSESETTSEGRSSTRGFSKSRRGIREERATAVHSIDNATHFYAVRLKDLPPQKAVVKAINRQPVRATTPWIEDCMPSRRRSTESRKALLSHSSFVTPIPTIELEMAQRRQLLITRGSIASPSEIVTGT
jgi:hypothetical protein